MVNGQLYGVHNIGFGVHEYLTVSYTSGRAWDVARYSDLSNLWCL